VARTYLACADCPGGVFAADGRLGVDGWVSPHALRLVCRAAAGRSFRAAADDLEEFCGLRISAGTVRFAAEGEGAALQRSPVGDAVRKAFQEAEGDVEFAVDGVMVNMLCGWRELRLAVFAKRKAGPPATPKQWDDRYLPAPAARFAFGSVCTAARFGPQWRTRAAELGIARTADVTVLGDGAKWIWRQAGLNLPGAPGLLDVYHAGEHLFAAAWSAFGEGSADGRKWAHAKRRLLLKAGSEAVRERLAEEVKGAGARRRGAFGGLADYLAPHADRTGYRERLAAGKSIGSGLIEGACKTVVGKRLRQTGARWRVRNADAMTALCCLAYSGCWDAHWTARAA
jgi:hypothetical protein